MTQFPQIPLNSGGMKLPFPVLVLGGIGLLHVLRPRVIPEAKMIEPEWVTEACEIPITDETKAQ